jgi:hypothetical protein
MKVGVSLIGMNRTYKDCFDNFTKMVIEPLKNMGHEVYVYLTTYLDESNENLINLYKPKKTNFLEFYGSHQRNTYLKGLDILDGEDLDLILCTRFDIRFKKKIFNDNFDSKKFNFCFREQNMWESHNFVTDNLFVFDYKFLKDFKDSLIFIHNTSPQNQFMHHIYLPVLERIGQENIVFLSDEIEFSHDNNFYDLVR